LQVLMAAAGAGEAGEAGGKVAAAIEGLNGGNHHTWCGLNVA
jgi:hypothetical protein